MVNLYNHLSTLLLKILTSALETRELAQKRDDLKQQIQICEANIQEKKKYIDGTQKSIKKLDEGILQKQNTVKCFKESVKGLRAMSNLLLQYEKTLEAELQRRQDSCNQDMKMFQERIENYRKIFQQHKDEYCQNALAKKLLNIQADNEEIEKRIRAIEDQIIAKDKQLKALQGGRDTCDSDQTPIESQKQQEPLSVRSSQQDDMSFDQDLQPQGTEAMQEDNQTNKEEKDTENVEDQADGIDESNASQVVTIGSTIWSKPDIGCEPIQGAEQKQQEQPAEEEPANTSCGSDVMEEMLEMMDADGRQESGATAGMEGYSQGVACNPSSPIRMTAVLNTPTFSLNSSPNASPGCHESSEMPAFVFPVNSGPSTPAFSGFGCGFDLGSSQHEESPFTFTSSYFSNKKSLEANLPGFLFESQSHPEVDFAFSFGSKSPQLSSSAQETGGVGDACPFSFSLDKF
ncbi:uncharacterized protein LOC113577923 isoform X2 [Electrophorus electricus]|uniref:uncharacterized protein LOC113577923 isoform X2 n=1 Tax=Electrophorus electricus TaxID=8005 RepID=UPI0015CFC7E7|nr:uncharacterized protein LOC113577923 isoform X2 [Electrophorus electricus]